MYFGKSLKLWRLVLCWKLKELVKSLREGFYLRLERDKKSFHSFIWKNVSRFVGVSVF